MSLKPHKAKTYDDNNYSYTHIGCDGQNQIAISQESQDDKNELYQYSADRIESDDIESSPS